MLKLKSVLKSNRHQSLPSSSGVYFFRGKNGKLLYIGKAINLKRRVSSYFQKKHFDRRIEELVNQIAKIEHRATDSVIEALILEANLIKKYQPFYNVKLKDDKSFVHIAVSKEEFPRVFIMRLNTKRLYNKIEIKRFFGPYISAKTARSALKILRRIFPFRGLEKTKEAERFYQEIMAIPENKERYKETLKNLVLFLEGKKKRIINNLEKKMKDYSRQKNYEEAAKIRNQIFALRHLQDAALLKNSDWEETFENPENRPKRIEAYDISNIFGESAAGSMVVFTDGKIDTDEYRRFRIKNIKNISDIAMLEEVLTRRFRHMEWKFPDLLIVDGGLGQLGVAKKVLKWYNLNIPLVAIAKGPDRKGEKIFKSIGASLPDKKIIAALRDEAHRFAIGYHRKLKRKNIFI